MLLSGLIGGFALLTLAMRVGYPNHQVIAFSLYGLSWVPLFMSFQAKRAFVRRHWPMMRHFVPAGAALSGTSSRNRASKPPANREISVRPASVARILGILFATFPRNPFSMSTANISLA